MTSIFVNKFHFEHKDFGKASLFQIFLLSFVKIVDPNQLQTKKNQFGSERVN